MPEILNDKIKNHISLFSVEPKKLVLLSICTLGFYSGYWIFQNWSRIQKINKAEYSPLIRSSLFFIFNKQLFEEIQALAFTNKLNVTWNPFVVACFFLLFLSGWYIPYAIFISIFVGVCLLPVNATCGFINEKQGVKPSMEGFNSIDWKIMFFGSINLIYGFFKILGPVMKGAF